MRDEATPMSQEDRDRVIELKQQGYGKRKIHERTGLPTKQIAKVLREEGLTPASQPRAQSKLDPFEKEVEHRVEQGLTTSRILREIRGARATR